MERHHARGCDPNQLHQLWARLREQLAHQGLSGNPWELKPRQQSLDGVAALPVLRELYASFNEVEDCSPLAQCELLETVDLEANRLATLEVRSPRALPTAPCLGSGFGPIGVTAKPRLAYCNRHQPRRGNGYGVWRRPTCHESSCAAHVHSWWCCLGRTLPPALSAW
jgi:hypothetical protein